MKSILITCHHLKNYAGSECMVLDFCLALKQLGFLVEVATFEYDEPIKSDFLVNNIRVNNVLYDDLSRNDFDLIISFHWVVLFSLLKKGLRSKYYVGFSLGTNEPLEFPAPVEGFFSWYYYNSQECMDFYTSALNSKLKEQSVFLNSVSSQFFNQTSKIIRSIKNIAVVSNHIPDELYNLKDLKEAQALNIHFYGRGKKSSPELITPEILSKYDVVITIGRTVQYCLALGIPVFCYDIFGGPGFITLENYEKAEHYNYSGRCSSLKKDALEIYSDLINVAPSMLNDWSIALKSIAEDRYSLSSNLKEMLSNCSNKVGKEIDFAHSNFAYLFAFTDLYLKRLKKEAALTKKNTNFTTKNNKLTFQLDIIKKYNADLKLKIIERDELLRFRNGLIKKQQISINKAQKVKSKNMDLAISYNFFNGEELLEKSIKNIRDEASHISVIYQETSNHGNKITNDALELLQHLKSEGVIDKLQLYTPNLDFHPSVNEFRKRKLGLKIANKLGLSHFLNMDADEFYLLNDFKKSKDLIINENITFSSVGSYFYLKKPIWRSELPDKTNVCFISKIDAHLQHIHKGDFPNKFIDPTRRFVNFSGNYRHFADETIMMHHMNLVRKSLDSKLKNSTNADKVEFMSQVKKVVEEWEFGELFKFPNKPEQNIIEVKDLFNLDGNKTALKM